MENRKMRRLWASLTMVGLIFSQFTTGVFPIPIAPVETAHAAGFFIEKERIDADEDDPVGPGDTIRYEITVRNDDTKDANARIIDPLPEGLEYIPTAQAPSCNLVPATPGRADEVICDQQPLPIGATRTVVLKFRVLDSVDECTYIENIADVWNDDPNYPTGIPPSWSNVIRTPVICPDPELDISKVARQSEVDPGDRLEYDITVENVGTGTAEDVEITDTIPTGLIFDSTRSDSECYESGNQIICDLGDIDENDDERVRIAFTVDSSILPTDPLCTNGIVNQATADGSNTDPDVSNSVTTPLNCPTSTLTITKRADRSTVEPGDTVTYTIKLKNNDDDITIHNAVIVDSIPAGLTFVSDTGDVDCFLSGDTVRCGPFNMDPKTSKRCFVVGGTPTICDDEVEVELTFDVTSAVCDAGAPSVLTNTADGTSDFTDPVWDTESIDVSCREPVLTATKDSNKTTVSPGDQVRFTINVENTGDGDAINVQVIDPIPNGLTFNDGASDNFCSQAGNIVTCGPFDLDAGRDRDVDIVFDVRNDAPCSDIIANLADVTASNADPTWTNQVNLNVFCPDPDLDLTKSANKSTVDLGDTVTYTLDIENNGTGDATDVLVADDVPYGFEFIPGSSDSRCLEISFSNIISCAIGDLDAGDDDEIRLIFRADDSNICGDTIDNTARAGADNHNTIYSNTVSVYVNCPQAELEATKSTNKTNVAHHELVTFTINVKNIGGVEAENVNVIDPIPNHLMYIDASSDPLCDQNGNVVECGSFDLDAGDDRDVDIVFKVLDTAPCSQLIANLADVTSDNAPTVWSNQVNINVDCADIQASKSANKSTVLQGEQIIYTIDVDNVGTTDADDITVHDIVPTGFTFDDAASDSRCDLSGNTVVCGPFDLDAGNDTEFELVFDVTTSAPCNQYVYNTATVEDTFGSEITATNIVPTFIDCLSEDFTVTKIVSSNQTIVEPGDTITYDITIENTGNATLSGIWVLDEIPTGLDFIDGSPSDSRCFEQGIEVKCGDDDILPGNSDTYTIAFTVNDSAPCGGSISNYAIVLFTGNGTLSGQTNTVTTTVHCPEPELDIIKTGPNKVVDGEEIVYDFTVTNVGSATATDVLVVDFFTSLANVKTSPAPFTFVPSGTTATRPITCTSDGTDVTCELGDIAAQDSVSFSLTFSTPEDTYCDQSIRNNADANEQPLGQPSSDWDDHIVVVECLEPDLTITKSGPTEVDAGDNVTYSFTIENNGDGDAEDVTVTDIFQDALGATTSPAPFTFDTAAGASCSSDGTTVTCDAGVVAANDTVSFTVMYTTPANTFCDENVLNEATVTENTGASTDDDDHTVTVRCLNPDIQATKSVDPATGSPGDTLTYSIFVENTGAGDANGLSITDTIPTGLTYDDAASDALCDETAGIVTCGTFDLTAGSDITVDLVFTISSLAPCDGQILNFAQVLDSGNAAVDTTNTVSTSITCPEAALDASKSSDVPSVSHNGTITYTIDVTNTGNATAENVHIDDPVPIHLTYDDSASDTTCDEVSNTIECDIGDILAGDTTSVDIVFTVDASAPCNEVISNLADVFADNAATVWSNVVDVDVTCTTDFEATKTADKPTVSPGDTLTYTIEVENTGQVTLGGLWIIDTIPTGLDFDALASDPRCFEQGLEVKCGDDDIPGGDIDTYTIVFDVTDDAPCGGSISNIADLVFLDNNNLSGQTNVATSSVTCPADLDIIKTGPTSVDAGDSVTYTITVENVGNAIAQDVYVSDYFLDASDNRYSPFTFVPSATNNCVVETTGAYAPRIRCDLGDMDPGDKITYTTTFDTDPDEFCGEDIYNNADVHEEPAQTSSSDWDDHEVRVKCQDAELDLEKRANRSKADIGDTIIYTVTVENIGSVEAEDIIVLDDVISELTFLPHLSSGLCGLAIGNQIECGPFNLNPGVDIELDLAFEVNSSATCDSTIYNQAEARADNAGPVLSDSVHVDIECDQEEADIEVEKDGPSQIMRGTTIVYDITVENNGPDTADHVIITDQIPNVSIGGGSFTDLTFNASLSDASCYVSGDDVLCGWFDLDDGKDRTIQIAFDVPSNAECSKPISNYVDVYSNTYDPILSNNDAFHVSTVNCATQTLDIIKSGPSTARHGELITYIVTVTNNLGYDVTKNRMIDPIPGNLDYVSANDSLCDEVSSTNEVICGEFDLDDGDSRTFILTFKVLSTAQCDSKIINIADIWSNHGGVDPEWSNAVSTTVLCDAEFDITKTDNRSTVKIGDDLEYEIRVTNTSTVDGQNIEIVDELPRDVDFISANAGGTYTSSTHSVRWIIDIDAGDTSLLTIDARVDNSADDGDVLLNEACVVNGSLNVVCDTDTTIVDEDTPEFTITKTDNRSTVQPGETLTYEITIRNIGDGDADDVEVIDTLPSDVTFVSADNNGRFAGGEVVWDFDLDAGDSITLEVEVTVDSDAEDGDVLFNTVEITGGPDDDDTTTVVVDPDETGCIDVLKETFDAQGVKLTPVTQFTFTLDGSTQTAVNDSNGNARFDNVPVGSHTVTETIPSGWVQDSVAPANGTVTVLEGNTCVTVTFKNSQTPVGTAKFTISKTDNKTTAEEGDTLTYEMEIKNISNVDATNVEVTDRVPDDTDFISASDSGSKSGETVTWFFDLDAGQTEKFDMKVKVNKDADDGDVITNTVTVKDGPSATDTTRIEDEDDDDDDDDDDNDDDDDEIRVTVNDDPDPVDVCHDDDLEYEIRLSNSGGGNERVDVTADLDSNTDYQSSSDGGKLKSGDRVEWDNIKLNRNSSKTLRLRVRVEGDTRDGDTLRLRVRVSGGESDTEITRVRNNGCESDDDDGFIRAPALTIDKTADRTEALAGSVASYTITIRNTGNEDLPLATLTDDYPEGQITISDPGGGADAGGQLRWDLGTLKANSTTVVRYRVRLKTTVTQGSRIVNTATVRAGGLTRSDDHTIVVPTPPQTGLGGFIKSLTQRDSYLSESGEHSEESESTENLVAVRTEERDTAIDAEMTADSSDATLPVMVWITTMLTGLGMGGLFGRRFLF